MSYPDYNSYNKWINCCKPIGLNGATGPTGPRGLLGPNGITGPTGPNGASGELILTQGSNIPSAININNYSLSTDASYYQITGTIASTISGFSGGMNGQIITIVNNTNQIQTFSGEDTNSLASNRLLLNGPLTALLPINSAAQFIYVTGLTVSGNPGQSRWLLLTYL